MAHVFELIPFSSDKLPKIQITGEAKRMENRLSIRYVIRGEVETILLPFPSTPTRKDDLWKATCFELFLAIPNLPEYWEFNMSPSGGWNVYHMDAYRQVNMQEEVAFSQLPFDFRKDESGYVLDISVDLNPIIQPQQQIQIGITTIIQTSDGNEIYWALSHPGAQADFHLRESFLMES